jgi:murein L,D-transpeptidase YcbB/YkuD
LHICMLMRIFVTILTIAVAAAIEVPVPDAAEPTPVQAQIQRLEQAIQLYRSIEQRDGWRPLGSTSLKFDQTNMQMADALRERLLLTGDLSALSAGDAQDDLTDAVKRFQRRHGLAVDGRVGPNTLAVLDVPLTTRIAQLELNKRRFEALPDLGPSYIQVNTAAASLEVIEQSRSVMEMSVIVGDRYHPTPAFHSYVTSVVFHPPWNVPHSISVREILPKLRRDPGYLARQEMVILNRPDDPFGRRVNWATVTAASFPFQLQQRPGPLNALGVLKFNIPNEFDVYLHDTPARTLFGQPKRALSHGCIRVSKPRELAAWLLGPHGWDNADIDAALGSQRTRQVSVERIVPVHVFYFTAFVDAEGQINFREDAYDRDNDTLNLTSVATEETKAMVTAIGCGTSG